MRFPVFFATLVIGSYVNLLYAKRIRDYMNQGRNNRSASCKHQNLDATEACPLMVHSIWYGDGFHQGSAQDQFQNFKTNVEAACAEPRSHVVFKLWFGQNFMSSANDFAKSMQILNELDTALKSRGCDTMVVHEDPAVFQDEHLTKLWGKFAETIQSKPAYYYLGAMSDLTRLLALERDGGIYVDIGDTKIAKVDLTQWVAYDLGNMPHGVRFAENHKLAAFGPMNHIIASQQNNAFVAAFKTEVITRLALRNYTFKKDDVVIISGVHAMISEMKNDGLYKRFLEGDCSIRLSRRTDAGLPKMHRGGSKMFCQNYVKGKGFEFDLDKHACVCSEDLFGAWSSLAWKE